MEGHPQGMPGYLLLQVLFFQTQSVLNFKGYFLSSEKSVQQDRATGNHHNRSQREANGADDRVDCHKLEWQRIAFTRKCVA
ncbi:MAG TPA: hypothetical protein VIX20_14870 [Ktedonobacteraceae bacterium]|jgi:hypothetical protein